VPNIASPKTRCGEAGNQNMIFNKPSARTAEWSKLCAVITLVSGSSSFSSSSSAAAAASAQQIMVAAAVTTAVAAAAK